VQHEAVQLAAQFSEFIKTKQSVIGKHFETKLAVVEKKNIIKKAKWEAVWIADKLKLALKELKAKALVEKVKAGAEKARARAEARAKKPGS
jgi:hypothetical protein